MSVEVAEPWASRLASIVVEARACSSTRYSDTSDSLRWTVENDLARYKLLYFHQESVSCSVPIFHRVVEVVEYYTTMQQKRVQVIGAGYPSVVCIPPPSWVATLFQFGADKHILWARARNTTHVQVFNLTSDLTPDPNGLVWPNPHTSSRPSSGGVVI